MSISSSRKWDELVQQQLQRAIDQIADDINRKIFFYPRGTMYFIFTNQFGIEPILFSSRVRAETEVLRLRDWAAYRGCDVGIGFVRYDTNALRDGTTYDLHAEVLS